MSSPLSTSTRQDFILLMTKNLNEYIKFIENILFYSASFSCLNSQTCK